MFAFLEVNYVYFFSYKNVLFVTHFRNVNPFMLASHPLLAPGHHPAACQAEQTAFICGGGGNRPRQPFSACPILPKGLRIQENSVGSIWTLGTDLA